MALAEPRRRQKWTLNPRGNLWADDQNKFGQKLMEKMGWEQGKGLGAKSDGRLEHISLRHKDDSKGVGFQGHDDTWLEHQDDFQAVLAALNAEHGTGPKDGDEGSKSLEETSKKSKRRVHYQKFTRGKDLANYSADDLGCILGTKSDKVGEKKKRKEERIKLEEEEEAKKESELGKESKEHGYVTIQGGSYQDYFAKKMAMLKAKGKSTFSADSALNSQSSKDGGEKEEDLEPRMVGFKQDNSDVADSKLTEDEEHKSEPEAIQEIKEETKKQKKKKKKDRKEKEEEENEQETVIANTKEFEKKKKSKKLKDTDAASMPMNTDEKSDKKKKRQREADDQMDGEQEEAQKPKKKKKKDRKEEATEDNTEVITEASENETITAEAEINTEKKKKKRKKEKEQPEQMAEQEVQQDEPEQKKEKEEDKKKKEKADKENSGTEGVSTESMKDDKMAVDSGNHDQKSADSSHKDRKSADSNRKFSAAFGFKGSNLSTIPGYSQF